MKKNRSNFFYLLAVLIILIGFSLVLFFFPNFIKSIEYNIYDIYNKTYVRIFPKKQKKINQDFLFIEIDSDTHIKLNSVIIDRKEFVSLNNILHDCNPSLIFYDYIFTTRTRSDNDFLKSIILPKYLFPCALSSQQASNMKSVNQKIKEIKNLKNKKNQNFYSSENLLLSFKEILEKTITLAHINSFADNDGIFRRMPLFIKYKDKYIPSVSLQFALTILNKSIDDIIIEKNKIIINSSPDAKPIAIPIDDNGEMLINFTFDRNMNFSKISYLDLLKISQEDINAIYELLEDKIIVITDSSFVANDYGKTPISINFLKSLLHAFSAETIISKNFVKILPIKYNIIILFLLSIIILFATIKLNANKFIILNFSILFIYLITSIILFSLFTIYISIFIFIAFFITSIIIVLLLKYIFEEKEKSFIKYAFNCYVPKTVVSQILKNRDLLHLEGRNTFVSIMFSDIANFTTISEIISPIELVKFLKYYNTQMTTVIKENNGIIDKYEGDAIMAEFGLPIEVADNEKLSAYNACKAAIEMQKKINLLKKEYTEINTEHLSTRIGINSGQVIAGNMGSDDLFDYTVIGDEVNLASRLEGVNKFYNTKIMIGEKTNELVKNSFFTRPIDFIRVKGRKTPEKVFELIDFKNKKTSEIYEKFLENYNKAFQFYIARNYSKTIDYIKTACQIIPEDKVIKQLEIKCKNYIKNPPPKDWDGVTILDSK